jgi:hypothetical protein
MQSYSVKQKAAHASKAGRTHCNAQLIIHADRVEHSSPDPVRHVLVGRMGNLARVTS